MSADVFATESIRRSTLDSWRSSPSRFIEDAAAERELVRIGYRDRLATELIANAADAAAADEDSPGEVAVWLDEHDGRERIHIANSGAPLDASGVAALSSLRASAKASRPGASVGRFGVGFTVAATVADRVEIRSRRGGIVFDRQSTQRLIADEGVDEHSMAPPLLRLPWPIDVAPADGHDTEVVLFLAPDHAGRDVLEEFAGSAVDLLLELPALTAITVAGARHERGEIADGALTSIAIGERRWIRFDAQHARWLLELDDRGQVICSSGDRLRAPTETDIELTIPARCITDLPTTPDRRGLDPSVDIADAAIDYTDFALALAPSQRLAVVPEPGFGANPYDVRLRDALLAELSDGEWLPSAAGPESEAPLLIPSRAVVLPDLTAELAAIVGPVIGQLVAPEFADLRSVRILTRLGVRRIGLADIAERLTGIDRDPRWWFGLYEALSVMAVRPEDFAELGALPVPRGDGRVIPGARGLAVIDGVGVPVPWLQTVDPDAAHPMLLRIGAEEMTAAQALSDPALHAAIEHGDSAELAEQVLDVIAASGAGGDDPDRMLPDWLGGLLIPDSGGDFTPADELLLADGPLAQVLVDDSPFAAPSPDWVRGFGAPALRAIGVGWGFAVIREEYPTGPDHDLPDEESWWASIDDDPEELVAVRDLDLVDPDKWAQALTALADDPVAAPLLADRRGYTAWWLRNFATIDGLPLGHYRRADDTALVGVLDPLEHPSAPAFAGALAALPVESIDGARILLAQLADGSRSPSPAVVAGVHAALAAAARRGIVDPADIEPPEFVRTLGGLAQAHTALVVDRPWQLPLVDRRRAAVLAPPYERDDAVALASLLDVETSGEAITAEPVEPGTPAQWAEHPDALAAAILLQIPLPEGELRLHDSLTVRVWEGDAERLVDVEWWVDAAGITHLDGRWRVPR